MLLVDFYPQCCFFFFYLILIIFSKSTLACKSRSEQSRLRTACYFLDHPGQKGEYGHLLPYLSDGQARGVFLEPFLAWSRLSFPQKTLLPRLFQERRRISRQTRAVLQTALWGRLSCTVQKTEEGGASVISLPVKNRGEAACHHRSTLSDTKLACLFPASVHTHPGLSSASSPTSGSLSWPVSFVHSFLLPIPGPTINTSL